MSDYIHGYTDEEQKRLIEQARFLSKAVFHNVDFSEQENLLEIGCGVGAETEILLELFPNLKKITGVDREEKQILTAKHRLKNEKRFEALQADATKLPFQDGTFDGVFICWILEHTRNPKDILKEAHRVLEPQGLIHLIEVNHDSFEVFPQLPVLEKLWLEFGDVQEKLGGDARVGQKLPKYLRETGFQDIRVFPGVVDSREYPRPGSQEFIHYFQNLIESGYPAFKSLGLTPPVNEIREEFEKLKKTEGAFLRYTFVSVAACR